MEKVDINNHIEQLQQLCAVCRRATRCKDHTKICTLKKLAWNYAKRRYEKREVRKLDGNC